ncbi:element excision factor XisH family protein [Coleofasciculus sp. B1-GNL1-01]|uniref:element excision factor XisH family protein n=1 Tax=Coleofasciculus sp. B1-GNL1-01 TaxID=3068484 RepID=UPI0040648DD3
MAKDIFHDIVKLALQKDSWTITHDPYRLRYGIADIYIDLAAQEAIAAEKEGRKIAVEVKSFVSVLMAKSGFSTIALRLSSTTNSFNVASPNKILFWAFVHPVFENALLLLHEGILLTGKTLFCPIP